MKGHIRDNLHTAVLSFVERLSPFRLLKLCIIVVDLGS